MLSYEERFELYREWIAALRSGDYEEGIHHHMLTHDEKWSVLGVLADIAVDGWWTPVDEIPSKVRFSDGWLPRKYCVLETPGNSFAVKAIPWSVFPFRNADKQGIFLRMQQFGFTFKEIADAMERRL